MPRSVYTAAASGVTAAVALALCVAVASGQGSTKPSPRSASGRVVASVNAVTTPGTSGSGSAADSAVSSSVTRRVIPKDELTIQREVFRYDAGARRDPFVSLMGTSDLRPMLSDLRLAVVVYDGGGSSRAVLRDVNTDEQYKIRVGQTLGRMRVAAIGRKTVTFTILEFGESRQETLALNDSTTVRTP